MTRSETLQMSRTPPVSEWRYGTVSTEPLANENYGSRLRSQLDTDHEPQAMGSQQPCFTRPTLAQSKNVGARRFTRLLLV
jgi:hypothetical protein